MAKKELNNGTGRYAHPAAFTDAPPLDLGLSEEFGNLPGQLTTNLGTVIGLVLRGGGYFGLSITDDGGAARIAVRCKRFTVDRRVYKLTDLQAVVSKIHTALRDPSPIPPAQGQPEQPVTPQS